MIVLPNPCFVIKTYGRKKLVVFTLEPINSQRNVSFDKGYKSYFIDKEDVDLNIFITDFRSTFDIDKNFVFENKLQVMLLQVLGYNYIYSTSEEEALRLKLMT